MTRFAPFRLRRAVLSSPARGRVGDEGPALLSPFGEGWSPIWSSVSRACRRASYLSLFAQRNVTQRKRTRMDRSCVEAARLREASPGFADSTSLCWQRTGPNPFGPPCGPFRTLLADPKRDEDQQQYSAPRCAVPLTLMPVPVGKWWTEKPLAGRARDRVASAAAHDVPSAEPGQRLQRRETSPHDRQAIGSHLLVTFLCEQKSDWVGRSRTIRLTRLAQALPRQTAIQGMGPYLRAFSRREKGAIGSATAQKEEGRG